MECTDHAAELLHLNWVTRQPRDILHLKQNNNMYRPTYVF